MLDLSVYDIGSLCFRNTLAVYFESKQFRNPGQDVSEKNGTFDCIDVRSDMIEVGYITKSTSACMLIISLFKLNIQAF